MMDGFGGIGLVGAIVLLLVFVAVVLLIVWAVRAGIPSRHGSVGETAAGNLTHRYAVGLFLQVKDFKPLSRPFLQLLSQPDSCHVAQTHEAHGVATAVCGSKRLVEVRRICCYAPFATPSGGNAGT